MPLCARKISRVLDGRGPGSAMPQSVPDAFSPAQRQGVYRAIYERRDIRAQFLSQPIPDAVLGRLLDAAHHGPSVGFMQPWDFIVIRDPAVRRLVHDCFVEANRRAAQCYSGARRELYDTLKLAGIQEAPVNLCITCDRGRTLGAGLGRRTDPATDLYSTACAVQNLWLAARAESLGVGWVSILDFDRLRQLLRIPARVVPVAYLCLGYVSEFPRSPELESAGWERRERLTQLIHFDYWGVQDEARAAQLLTSANQEDAP
jgi:5,6-dimethylbenzimidazole synthase